MRHRDITAYTVLGGWSITPEQVYIGMVRVLYPFFGGLLLFRIGKLIRVKAGFWWCSLLVVAALVMPRIGGETNAWQNGIYNAACILLLFPVIVAMGAGSEVKGKHSVAVCNYLGEISYPLYITHYPFAYMQDGVGDTQSRCIYGSARICLRIDVYLVCRCGTRLFETL